MNKEKQRIKIAEVRGWSNLQYSDYKPLGKAQLVGRHPGGSAQNLLRVPDYLNDLNAMHEVEETLTEHEWNQMFELLIHIRWRDANATERHGIGKQKALSPSRATAAQRSEAILKTLNLWEDE